MDRKKINRYQGIIILLIIIIIFPFITRSSYYINILVFIGIYTLLALGLTLLLGYAGQISFGQAGFYGLGAYVSGIFTVHLGLDPWLALPIAIILTAISAFLIGFSTLHLKGLYLAMATLGVGIIFQILFVELKDLTGGAVGLMDIPHFSIFGMKLDTDIKFYFLVWAIVLLVFFLIINLVNSRVGRALRAVQGSEIASNCMGINSFKYKVKVFILCACLASVSGSLYAHYITYLSPSVFDFTFSIYFLVMTIVGGQESIWGALYGATILTLLHEYLRRYEDLYVMFYGIILMVVLIFFNKGIVGGLDILLKKIKSRFLQYG